MKKLGALLPFLAFMVLALLLALALGRGQFGAGQQLFASHVGQAAPTEKLFPYDPAQMKGSVYLLNFFSSWCAPCRAEHEHLLRLKQAGVKIFGIAYRDSKEAIDKFMAAGNPYQGIAYDQGGAYAVYWGITGVPETYLVDKGGIVRFHLNGPLTDQVLEAELLPMLKKLEAQD